MVNNPANTPFTAVMITPKYNTVATIFLTSLKKYLGESHSKNLKGKVSREDLSKLPFVKIPLQIQTNQLAQK